MNRYLEKVAESISKKNNTGMATGDKVLIGAGGVGIGAGLMNSEFSKGNITGRETLYHGSSKGRIDNIKRNGLLPNQGGGITKIIDGKLEEKNKPFVFAAKNKLQAAGYAAQQEAIESGKLNSVSDKLGMTPEIQSNTFKKLIRDKGTVAKINLPTWKSEHKGSRNPELRGMFKQIDGNFFDFNKKQSKKLTYEVLQNQVHTHRGAIGPEYIKGSDKYRANTIKEVGSYIRANPKRFLKGVGKASVGAGILAGGASILNSLRDQK